MAKRRPLGCLTIAGVLVVLFALEVVMTRVLDRVLSPWAFAKPGRPAVVGTWVGTLTTATGMRRGALLDLRREETPPRSRRNWTKAGYFDGSLRSCDEKSVVRDYTVRGEPADRHARRLGFTAGPLGRPPPEGLTFGGFRGTWDGRDRLELRLDTYWQKDGSAITGPEYPDTQSDARLAMTRGGEAEFRALCATLARSRPTAP